MSGIDGKSRGTKVSVSLGQPKAHHRRTHVLCIHTHVRTPVSQLSHDRRDARPVRRRGLLRREQRHRLPAIATRTGASHRGHRPGTCRSTRAVDQLLRPLHRGPGRSACKRAIAVSVRTPYEPPSR